MVFSKKLSNYIEALVPYFIALNEKEEDILSYSLDVIKEIETNGNLPTNYWNSFLSNPTFAAELNNIGVILTSQQGQLIVDTDKLLLLCKETILRNQDNTVLTNNFVKDEIDEAPTLTAGSTQDMSFGGITTGSPTSEFSFYTPGNHGTTATLNAALIAPHSPLEYPIYNEVLGIFALLNTPRVLVSRTVHDYSNNYSNVDKKGITYRNTWNNDKRLHFTFKGHQEWSQKYQVKIIDNIEYALNDVLNIKSCKIKASIELAGTPVGYNNLSVNFPHNNSNGALVGYAFSDPAYFSNIEKSNIPMTGYEPLVEKCSGNDYQEYVGTIPFMKLGGLQQCSPNAQQPTNILLPPYHLRTTVKYSSPFTDIDELNSLVMGFGLKNEVMEFKYDTYQDPTLISQLQTNGSYVIPIIN